MSNLQYIAVPVHGIIPLKTSAEISPYDRNVAYLDTLSCEKSKKHVAVFRTENDAYYAVEGKLDNLPVQKARVLEPYAYKGRLFRYNMTDAIVSLVSSLSEEMQKENENWLSEGHKSPLFVTDDLGYFVEASVGLSYENWFYKPARDEYLDEWLCDLYASIGVDKEIPSSETHLIDELAKNGDFEKLARDIVSLASSYDWYSFADAVGDAYCGMDSAMIRVLELLVKKEGIESLILYCNGIADPDLNADDTCREEAQRLRENLTDMLREENNK